MVHILPRAPAAPMHNYGNPQPVGTDTAGSCGQRQILP